ncbi:MAG: hypothetical protein FWH31_06040 [Streptococcaceae bacterium]|nr:hypothetical protein [Streptococcaceae bacterium]
MLLISPLYRGGGVAIPTRCFAFCSCCFSTDSGATKLRRPFAERRAKHVAP